MFETTGDTGMEWRKALLPNNATIEEAMASINDSGLGIALIVDISLRLVGVVTDGDLRRAVLARRALSAPVLSVMNRTPVTVERGVPISVEDEQRFSKVRGHPIPIVTADNIVVGLLGVGVQVEAPRRDNWVLLMAGGFGTRLGELTKNCPKPMLKVGGRPILELIIEQLIHHGFHKFYISVHYLPEVIVNHFGDGSQMGVTIKYLYETQPLGTGGALGSVGQLDSKPILVMNCDLITRLDLNSLADFHEEQNNALTVCVREYGFPVPFGVAEGHEGILHRLVEKPLQRFFVNAGIYVVNPELVATCQPGKRIDMPDFINELLAKGVKIGMFPVFETWLDVGRPDDFSLAQSISVKA